MGLLDQIGVEEEVNYGDPVVVSRFFEFVSESLDRRNRTIQSDAIRASGRKLRRGGGRRVLTGHDGGGDVTLEVGPDLYGVFFKHALGAVTTTQPDDVNAPSVFEHEFTFGGLRGKSLTVQKGVEQEDGTVVPLTFAGCKITSWRLEISVDGFLRIVPTFDAQKVLTSEALAVASYVFGNLFHFQQGSLNLGGGPIANVSDANVGGDNGLKSDRYFLGNQGLKQEPRQDGWPTITGQLTAEFVDRASVYDAYAADSPLELVLSFVGANIEDAFNEELTVTVPEVRLGGDTPKVDGPSIPSLTVPYEGFDDGVSENVTVLLRNADATP